MTVPDCHTSVSNWQASVCFRPRLTDNRVFEAKTVMSTLLQLCCLIFNVERRPSPRQGRASYLAGSRLHTFHGQLPPLPSFLPSFLFCLPSPSIPFPSRPLSPSSLRSIGSLNAVSGLGVLWAPPAGLRRSSSGNRIWCILALKADILWRQFY